MKAMKLMSLVVVMLLAFVATAFVSAGTLPVSIDQVNVNDVEITGSNVIAASPEETVPVVIKFTSAADLEDLKVKVWVEGYKNDVSTSTTRFDALNGSSYIKRLSLTFPTVEDMDDVDETLTLYVRISDKNDEVEEEYKIRLQRDSYVFEVLSVEAPYRASAGEVVALDIVLKNIGSRELEDAFVSISMPELGVSRKVYFGDLTPTDDADADKEDARERRAYIVIPSDVKSGDYTLEVKASDYDATATAKKLISITGLNADNSTGTATPVTGKDKIPTSVIVLTVALVIIFLVLLVVLIVLLTKKPAEKSEDFGETSYY